MAENHPLKVLGLPLPGPTGCVADNAPAPVFFEPKVNAQFRFMPERAMGQRVIVDHSQVWEARLTVDVMTGYDERHDGGCRRFWPHLVTQEARVMLFEDNRHTYEVSVPEVPGWGTVSVSARLSHEVRHRDFTWVGVGASNQW